VASPNKFVGKRTELSCGYGIGPGALYKNLRGLKVDINEPTAARAQVKELGPQIVQLQVQRELRIPERLLRFVLFDDRRRDPGQAGQFFHFQLRQHFLSVA